MFTVFLILLTIALVNLLTEQEVKLMAKRPTKEDNNHCPGCKAYKELGMDACLGCCGRK